MKKLFISTTKTTLHGSFWWGLDYNCGLGERFAGFVHNSPDNVLLSHKCSGSFSFEHATGDDLSDNIYRRVRTCIRYVPDPTQLLLWHSSRFPLATPVGLIDCRTHFELCFLCPRSSRLPRMTKCIHVFRAVANPNNSTKKRKTFFTKTTWHEISWQRLPHNCFLDTQFVFLSSHNIHDNILWEHNVFSDNVCTLSSEVYTEWDLVPTLVWVIHEGIFLIWAPTWSIGIATPFQLCFWCQWSFARWRMTKCKHGSRAATNPNNSTKKAKKFHKNALTSFILAWADE